MKLQTSIKDHAYDLGADLIGFGNIERCEHAPMMMSPQGIYPDARTVVVMALHHPDACVELGGEQHPQVMGPYSVQYFMNARLDELAYRMATFIEKQGYGAIPIASSNIWRYNQYKELTAVFAPDLSHIYMSVVAGLTEIGFHGIAISPEYGARNRFITVITDALIEPDPLIPPGTLCDQCMLCRKKCPTHALEKEIAGENVLKIEDYEYRFPNKNLWRCAWAEHFELDLDMDIPEKVNEQVILDNIRKHGLRSDEMGQCLKSCLPPRMRTFDRSYSSSPVRRNACCYDEEIESRKVNDRIIAEACKKGAEYIHIASAGELKELGIDITKELPGAKSAITLMMINNHIQGNTQGERSDASFYLGARHKIDSICFDITRQFEEIGFRSVMSIERSASHYEDMVERPILSNILLTIDGLKGKDVVANTVITRKTVSSRKPDFNPVISKLPRNDNTSSLTTTLIDFARSLGADLIGISSISRLNDIAAQIRPCFDGQEILVAEDKAAPFSEYVPEIRTEKRKILVPDDYLPGARSVIVIALRYHEEVFKHAAKPPAEAVGPYAFQTYITNWLATVIGIRLIKKLEAFGYKGVMTADLMGSGSFIANPRGPQEDTFSNRFAAVAAGLGYLSLSGRPVTLEFGIRQSFMAIITDAELAQSTLRSSDTAGYLCAHCNKECITSCPSKAIKEEEVRINCEGLEYRFNQIDNGLCDWAKRYALIAKCGFGYIGSKTDIYPGSKVTKRKLCSALKKLDPIKKYRPVVAEPCVLNCPYANRELEKGDKGKVDDLRPDL